MGYPDKPGNDELLWGTVASRATNNRSRSHPPKTNTYPSANSCVSIDLFNGLDPVEAKDECLGGTMRRDLALSGATRQMERPARSIACIAFVTILGAAFWVGAAWIVDTMLRLYGQGL